MATETLVDEPKSKKRKFDIFPLIHKKDSNTEMKSRKSNGATLSQESDNGQDDSDSLSQVVVNDIRQKLIEAYKVITLPNVSWMDNGSLLLRSFYVQLELSDSHQLISLQNIFDGCSSSLHPSTTKTLETLTTFDGLRVSRDPSQSGKKPNRILIEAPPGFGKTTLAHKIIYDWAMQEDYVKHFKFAFLITLRNLQQSIPEELAQIAADFVCEQKEIVKRVIDKFAKETLIILDGFDELSANSKEHVLRALYFTQYKFATIIVTCRTGSFILTQDEKHSLRKGFARSLQCFEKKISIKGLNCDNRRMLLEKLVESDRARRIEEIIQPMDELFACPLLVTLLAVIVDDNDDFTIETRTDLFKSLIDCVVRRSMSRSNVELPSDFTIFSNSESFREYQDVFYRFGKLSANNISHDRLQFDCTDDTEKIYMLGFLVKYETKSKFNVQYHYEAFHKIMLEFAVALMLWIDYENDDNTFTAEAIGDILKLFVKYQDTSMIIPFLCGLLGDEVSNFFLSLIPHCTIFSTSPQSIWYILAECKGSVKLPDEIVLFFPPTVNIGRVISGHNLEKLFSSKSFRCDDLSHLNIDKLSKIGKVKQLEFSVGKNIINSPVKPINNRLGCDKLKFTLEFTPKKSEARLAEAWLQTFKTISAPNKNLTFSGGLHPLVLEYINNNVLKDTPINKLTCRFIGKPAEDNIVTYFLQNNQLKKLKLLTSDGSCLGEVFSTVSISNYLETIHLESLPYVVDISKLTCNGTRQWKKVNLVNTNVDCTAPLVNPKCISYFGTIGCDNSPAVGKSVSPEILHCDYKFMTEVCDSISVKELILVLYLDENCVELSMCLSRFKKRIELVNLKLHIVVKRRSKFYKIENVITECLKCVMFSEVLLQFPTGDVPWQNYQLKSLPEIIIREGIRTHTLILINYDVIFEEMQPLMHSLSQCLDNDNVKEVVFAFSGREKKLFKIVNNFNVDCIKYDVEHSTIKALYDDTFESREIDECIRITPNTL